MTGDYLEGRGRVRLNASGVAIEGVCRTHGHLDHAPGLAHHASRRRLERLPAARVFAPEEAVPDLAAWLAFSQRLEKVDYGLHLTPVRPGRSVMLRNDLELKVLPGRHRVPTVGYLFSEIKRKLKDEFLGLPGEEIAAMRSKGVEVTRREETPLLAYPGDCGPAIFEAAPELFQARVLLIECSFVKPEDLNRARDYEHLHLQDFLERAALFQNEVVVLTHFSQRDRVAEIREALRALPATLARRVMAFLPD